MAERGYQYDVAIEIPLNSAFDIFGLKCDNSAEVGREDVNINPKKGRR
jgi:hypothetical protein